MGARAGHHQSQRTKSDRAGVSDVVMALLETFWKGVEGATLDMMRAVVAAKFAGWLRACGKPQNSLPKALTRNEIGLRSQTLLASSGRIRIVPRRLDAGAARGRSGTPVAAHVRSLRRRSLELLEQCKLWMPTTKISRSTFRLSQSLFA